MESAITKGEKMKEKILGNLLPNDYRETVYFNRKYFSILVQKQTDEPKFVEEIKYEKIYNLIHKAFENRVMEFYRIEGERRFMVYLFFKKHK